MTYFSRFIKKILKLMDFPKVLINTSYFAISFSLYKKIIKLNIKLIAPNSIRCYSYIPDIFIPAELTVI